MTKIIHYIIKHIMKKATFLAMACALFMGQSMLAQGQQEIKYTEDPAQGYIFNSFKDNWFISAEGGANIHFSRFDKERSTSDRFSPAAGIYVGKWFSPVIGLRFGGNFLSLKGLSKPGDYVGLRPWEHQTDGLIKQRVNGFGPVGDVMLNLTNWWCGYKPNRVYNASLYVGAGAYFSYAKNEDGDWKKVDNLMFAMRAGLLNKFRVSNHFDINLDIRYQALASIADGAGPNHKTSDLAAFVGVTYNFNKTGWNAPVVPVIPEAENCDALRARLAAADSRIADLEKQLRDCLNRPVEKVEAEKAPVATIFYPIGVSRISRENRNVINAISDVMKANPNTNYLLTGWADNYTGSDKINIRLRKARVEGVKNLLLKNGVPAGQIEATTNNANRMGDIEDYVALDRCVTIDEK